VDNWRVVDSVLGEGIDQPLVDGLVIGRDADCQLVISHSSVSRRHAEIHDSAGHWYVEDLGSRNGTFVEGTRVAEGARCRLRHGDRLGVANVVLVVSLISGTADLDATSSIELAGLDPMVTLSPYQLQLVRLLAAPWLVDGSEPASNLAVAEALGTPAAAAAVKAALRRVYAKAGLSGTADRAKRRELCRIAREHGWI
jgi:pSer/pThr/pTyr-binding forkhead associated (FHA) protein